MFSLTPPPPPPCRYAFKIPFSLYLLTEKNNIHDNVTVLPPQPHSHRNVRQDFVMLLYIRVLFSILTELPLFKNSIYIYIKKNRFRVKSFLIGARAPRAHGKAIR